MKSGKLWMAAVILLACSVAGLAQTNPDLEQGMKPYGSYHGGNLDQVSISNGNLFFRAPLFSYAQRGELDYPLVLQYNSKNFSTFQIPPGPGCPHCLPTEYVVFGADGNDSQSQGASVTLGFQEIPGSVVSRGDTGLTYFGIEQYVNTASLKSGDGSLHQLVNSDNGATLDGSGWSSNTVFRDSSGKKYGSVVEDPNGNQITVSQTAWTDTLGRQIPVVPGPAAPDLTPPPSTVGLGSCPALNYPFQPVTYAYSWGLPTVNGGTLPLIVCYASVYVRTNFFSGVSGGGLNGPHFFDLGQNFTMLQSVVFPDGTYWAFKYDAADPNNTASIAFADLLQITLPTGGTLSYTWQFTTAPGCGSDIGSRGVLTRTVNANDNSGPDTWQYNGGLVTDPLGNDTVHTFSAIGGSNCTFYETQTQYYQGSHTGGTLLKTINTDYQSTPNPYDPMAISTGRVEMAKTVANVLPIRVTTTLPNGLVSKVETTYDNALTYHGPLDGTQSNVYSCDPDGACQWGDYQVPGVSNFTGSYGKVLERREYDWGQPNPGLLLRRTVNTYLWQTNSAYLTNNFLDLVTSTTVYDGAGNQVAQTNYGYDEYSLNNPGVVATQHDSNPVNGLIRGNQTSVHRWLNGSTVSTANCPIAVTNGFLVSYATYNDTGTVNQSTDACGSSAGDPNHTTTFGYSASFAGAYPTTVTNALGQSASTNYDFNTGLVTSQTDANGQINSSSYDSLWRPLQINHPDGGQATFCYTDAGGATCSQGSAPFKVVVSAKLNATQNEVLTGIVDGVGRTTETQLNSNPSCSAPGSRSVITYDVLGRKASTTNPFCTTSDSTYGVTSYAYDALGRSTQLTHPDNTSVATSYTGRAAQVSDEGNGTKSVQRISQSDALGRLAAVCEVSSASQLGSGGTPVSCGLDIAATGFLTSYGYDTLGNLTSVSQGGFIPRSFHYDSLSRLTSATNPESGTITYAYDANGNMVGKIDARNITTTYAYDFLNRLTGKTYSDTTPAVNFVYDTCPAGGCPAGVTPQLTVGRMVESSTANARTFSSYDSMGRVIKQWQCTPVNCAAGYIALSYGYDLSGALTSQNNGFGVTLTSTYDTAARLTGVTSSLVDSSHPASLASSIQYNAPGLPQSETLGNTATETLNYDKRLRLTSLTATSPTASPSTPGRGWVKVNGTSDASRQNPAIAASAQVTVSGNEHSYSQCTPRAGCINVYDSGKVFITVNGHEYDYNFSGSDSSVDTASSVAHGLVAVIQADGARVVNASCSDNPCTTPVITLTALSAGSTGNSIAFTTGDTFASGIPRLASQGPSFTANPASGHPAGGQDASTTYDTGTVTITLNGTPSSVTYGSTSTSTSLASSLASALSQGGLVTAIASGNQVNITSSTVGASTNYSLSISSSSSNGFSPPSFTQTDSGAALTGGAGASAGLVYSMAVNYAPNGDVLSANDSSNGNWTYSYDDFNRLTGSNKNAGQQIYSYVYDRFGNRWQQNAAPGTNQFLGTFTGNNNRLDGYQYDAAGNLLVDNVGQHYAYDAESRITSINSGAVTCTYDANGERVEKNVGGVKTDYLYDLSGNAIAEINASGAVTREELFAGGKHLATYVNNNTYFNHGDWLGSERVRSDMTGAGCESIASLPFGDGQSTTGSCGDPSTRHFTGKERDSETGLDLMGLRYYGSALGRFTTPDPEGYGSSTPDPQSWNMYAYARNNPLRFVDPDGMTYHVCDEHGKNCSDQSDKEFDQNKANGQQSGEVWKDGKIYVPDGNGDLQLRGTFVRTDVDIPGDPEANRNAAAMIGKGGTSFVLEFMKQAAINAVAGVAVRGVGLGVEALNEARLAKNAAAAAEDLARTRSAPVGRLGSPMEMQAPGNIGTEINGRWYTGHALDSMQGRGLVPSVVEDTIANGAKSAGNTPGTTVFTTDQARVVVNSSGGVISTNPL